MQRYILKTTTALSLMFLLSACGMSHKMRMEKFNIAYNASDYCQATDILLDESDVCSKESDDIDFEDFNTDIKLNAGTSLFLANKTKISSAFFESADATIQENLNSNGIGRGMAEIVANASAVDYAPMVMDSIYLHSYQVLNALKLENKEEAKIQIKRANEAQANAVQKFSDEIEKAKEENTENSGGIMDKFKELAGEEAEKLLSDIKKSTQESTQKVLKEEYSDLSKWKGYANYVNPYATYLSGLYFLVNAEGKNDIETASTFLKRTAGMMPNNKFVKEDLALAEKMADGKINSVEPTTWIVFENGEVADLAEFRLDLPIFLFTNDVKTASISLPRVNQREIAFDSISVVDGKNNVATQTIADIDNIFISEFNEKLPVIIGKSVAKLTLQTALQSIAQQKFGDLGGIAVSAYSVATAGADLRSWSSLPKNVQIAKIKKAKSDTLVLNIGENKTEVKVPTTGHSLVYVRVPTNKTAPTVSVINL